MGVTVRQKKEGKGKPWWVFISHNSRRTSRRVGDKKAAEEVASKIRARLELGEYPDKTEPKKTTFRDYAEDWMRIIIPVTCKASTLTDYRYLLDNHILPAMGEMDIRQIGRGTVKDFLLTKAKDGYAHSTVGHMKNAISGVLTKAVDDEVISINPAYRLGRMPRPKDLRKDMDCLTREELKLLLDTAHKYYPQDYPLFLLLAMTGLRIGEALALQWGDVDFNGRFITVERNLSRRRIETPKNGKSRRVDMSLKLTQVLMDLKKQGKRNVVLPFNRDNSSLPENVVPMPSQDEGPDWIFTNGAGEFFDGNNWRKRTFNRCLKKAGLRKIRVHDLRHTYASLLIQDGQSLVYVRDQLGHYSIKVTVDIYGHLVPGGNKAAVDRLDESLSQHPSAPPARPAESQNLQPIEIANVNR